MGLMNCRLSFGGSPAQHWFTVDSMKVKDVVPLPTVNEVFGNPPRYMWTKQSKSGNGATSGIFPGNVLWVLCLGRQSVSCFLTCCFLIWKVSFPLWRMANRSQVLKLTLYMVGIWINCILYISNTALKFNTWSSPKNVGWKPTFLLGDGILCIFSAGNC